MRLARTNGTPTDAELLRRSRRSPEAFRAVYDRHARRVHAFFRRRTADENAAMELTAETFAAAWLSRNRFVDRAGGSAAPWLFGIARNVLNESVRRNAIERAGRERLRLAFPAEPCRAPVDEAWLDGLDDDLADALAELPEDQRRAVELRVLDDRDYEDVAGALGCTPAAARVRVSRGLAGMRRRLTTATPGGSR